jgi:hypothetical protein
MNPIESIQQQKKERLRGRCLHAVYFGGSLGATDLMVVNVVTEEGLDADREGVRKALGYLEQAGLVLITRRATAWSISTTVEGPAGIQTEVS